jgi:hypothetical protein
MDLVQFRCKGCELLLEGIFVQHSPGLVEQRGVSTAMTDNRFFLFNCWPYSFHVHPFHADFIPRFSFSHHSTPYRHIFVCVLFDGRNYSASTRSTRISSRGLVAPTIQPPIVTYLHIAVPSVL